MDRPVARLVTRMQGEDDGLMIGVTLRQQGYFKPNTVYEIVEVLGVLTLREVGKACGFEKGDDPAQRHLAFKKYFPWAEEIQNLLAVRGSRLFMTRAEYDAAHEPVKDI